ncbi:MAG TPA: amidohydrolase family protein [Longimicrobiales bacterium]|nr:amidohydrolase family protein [Longimicrobiales bacterium]
MAPPIRDGAVLVDGDGRIVAVGPDDTVPTPDGAEQMDLGEAAILPGLVNAHAHLDLAFLRGGLEDLAFPDWIAALVSIRRQAGLHGDDFIAAARLSCVEMLAAGVTTVGATEDSDGAFTALRESGMRGIVYREVFGPDPSLAEASMAGLRQSIDAMRPSETELVRAGISPHSPISVSDALFAAAAEYALAQRLPVAVHTAESAAERDLVVRGEGVFARRLAARGIATPVRGRSTVQMLERTRVLDCAPLLIHCVTVDADDVRCIADSRAAVVHCPVANARLGHGVAPVTAMREAGITVALGSDSVASNNRVDILEEARAAQLFQRATTGSPSVLPAADVLRMATLDGARSLGLDHVTGDLRAGLDADLCAVRLGGAHTGPVHDPVAAVVHSARASDVALTIVRGRILHRNGTCLTIDAAAAMRAVQAVADRIRPIIDARHVILEEPRGE